MAYSLAIPITLGAAYTGLTLSARLVDTSGTNVGSLITTGFVEFAGGNYGFYHAAYPDGFRGYVKILDGSELMAVVAMNPQEAENLDAKISSVAGSSGAGADTVTILIEDADGDPVPDVEVWITSTLGGSVVAGSLSTNDDGEAVFLLDAGSTYYLYARKGDWNPHTGTSFTAVAD